MLLLVLRLMSGACYCLLCLECSSYQKISLCLQPNLSFLTCSFEKLQEDAFTYAFILKLVALFQGISEAAVILSSDAYNVILYLVFYSLSWPIGTYGCLLFDSMEHSWSSKNYRLKKFGCTITQQIAALILWLYYGVCFSLFWQEYCNRLSCYLKSVGLSFLDTRFYYIVMKTGCYLSRMP
jgi:hypothetical protein